LSTADVEIFLARLYTDADLLARFLRSPHEVLSREPLTAQQRSALAAIDPSELILAADSYRRKRASRHG
jgi:hypothetical protein